MVYAGLADSRFTYMLLAKSGMAVNIADDIESTGRMTAGVKAMALDNGDLLISAMPVKKNGAITVLTTRGYIKSVSIGEYEISARNRKGLRITGKDTGDVAFASFGVVPPNLAIYADGNIQVINSKYIPYDNRAGKGKQVLKDEFVGVYNPVS